MTLRPSDYDKSGDIIPDAVKEVDVFQELKDSPIPKDYFRYRDLSSEDVNLITGKSKNSQTKPRV